MDEQLLAEILTCEIKVWQALVDGDAGADAAALSEDFLGVYPDGFSGKSDHIAQLQDGATVQSFELSQERLLDMGPDHVALCYCADFLAVGKEVPGRMYVNSIWRREGEGWINIFSQDTPAGGPAGTGWV